MTLKQFLSDKIVRGRKPWSVASDVLLVVMVLMLIFTPTRSILLAGVADVRTLFTGTPAASAAVTPLEADGWNWALTDGKGASVGFGSMRGNVIFLNQWATWCPPCRAEMNSIERLYKDYGSRVKFVMLTGDDQQKVRTFIEKQGYTFPVYFGNAAGESLATRSIPSTVIISRSGGVIMKKNGAFNWNAKMVRRLLDRLLTQSPIRPVSFINLTGIRFYNIIFRKSDA